jgi:hypothetical protein
LAKEEAKMSIYDILRQIFSTTKCMNCITVHVADRECPVCRNNQQGDVYVSALPAHVMAVRLMLENGGWNLDVVVERMREGGYEDFTLELDAGFGMCISVEEFVRILTR